MKYVILNECSAPKNNNKENIYGDNNEIKRLEIVLENGITINNEDWNVQQLNRVARVYHQGSC